MCVLWNVCKLFSKESFYFFCPFHSNWTDTCTIKGSSDVCGLVCSNYSPHCHVLDHQQEAQKCCFASMIYFSFCLTAMGNTSWSDCTQGRKSLSGISLTCNYSLEFNNPPHQQSWSVAMAKRKHFKRLHGFANCCSDDQTSSMGKMANGFKRMWKKDVLDEHWWCWKLLAFLARKGKRGTVLLFGSLLKDVWEVNKYSKVCDWQ